MLSSMRRESSTAYSIGSVFTIGSMKPLTIMEVDEDDVTIGHEASVSKIGEEQLFYLMSRGMTEAEGTAMIVNGFIEPIVKTLPMDYAIEMNRLITLQMQGAIG